MMIDAADEQPQLGPASGLEGPVGALGRRGAQRQHRHPGEPTGAGVRFRWSRAGVAAPSAVATRARARRAPGHRRFLGERGPDLPFPPAGPGPGVDGEQTERGAARRRGPLWPVGGPGADGPGGHGEPLAPGREAVPSRDDPARFINRELSWLEFGARLLDLVADDRLPLLERVKFLAIFAEGLDEFFQVRVAGLEDQVAAGLRTLSPDGLSPRQQLAAITARATELVERHSRAFLHDSRARPRGGRGRPGRLAHPGRVGPRPPGRTVPPADLPRAHPAGRGPGTSVPLHLQSLAQPGRPGRQPPDRRGANGPGEGPIRSCPGWCPCPTGRRFVLVEQVVAAHLDSIFPAMRIEEHQVFRVTRNVDLSVDEDEAGDLLAALELELHRRRFGQAVRLEVSSGISTDLLDMLVAEVDVPEANVYLCRRPPRPQWSGRPRPSWTVPTWLPEPWTPVTPPPLRRRGASSSPCWPPGRPRPPPL